MNLSKKSSPPKKHMPGVEINEGVKDEIEKRVEDKKLPCAVAFAVAEKLMVTPQEVGVALDLLKYKITKCQLGLFGYQPDKKRVKGLVDIPEDLKKAINEALVDNRLACKSAWQIAEGCHIGKMTVSSACETLGIKIKPCQLGAF